MWKFVVFGEREGRRSVAEWVVRKVVLSIPEVVRVLRGSVQTVDFSFAGDGEEEGDPEARKRDCVIVIVGGVEERSSVMLRRGYPTSLVQFAMIPFTSLPATSPSDSQSWSVVALPKAWRFKCNLTPWMKVSTPSISDSIRRIEQPLA